MTRILFCFLFIAPFSCFSQSMDFSGKNISVLPDSIFDGRTIVSLDLSKNQFTELPLKLKDIPGLTKLNLEDNPLSVFPKALSQIGALESLNISNTPIFNGSETSEELIKLKRLKEFIVHNEKGIPAYLPLLKKLKVLKVVNSTITFSSSRNFLKVEELLVDGNSFSTLNVFLSSFPSLSKFELINRSGNQELQLSNLRGLASIMMSGIVLNIDSIVKYNPKIQTFGIFNVTLSQVPKSISRLKYLRNLYLVNTNLTSIVIPSVVKLRFLNIKGNSLENAVVNRLKRKVQDGNVIYDAQKKFISPPIEEYCIKPLEFAANGDSSSILAVNESMRFVIPKNAFLYPDGSPVRGIVDIQYREFKDPLDFVASGIPMSYYEDGTHNYMQSLQMFEFRPYKDGVALISNPVAPVIAEYQTTNIDQAYQLYSLDEKNELWVNIGSDDVRRINPSASSQMPFRAPVYKKYEEKFLPPKEPQFNYQVKLEMVYVNYAVRKDYWAIYFSHVNDREKVPADRFKTMDELEAINLLDWKLKNEEEYYSLKQKMKDFDIQEIDFDKKGSDEVVITLIGSSSKIQFVAEPIFRDELNPNAKFKNINQLLSAIRGLEKVKAKKWKKIDHIEKQMLEKFRIMKVQYDTAVAQYYRNEEVYKKMHQQAFNEEMKEYEMKVKDWNEKSKLYQQFVRFFVMPRFGIANWDQVNPIYVGAGLIAKLKEAPFKMKTEQVFLCNKENNSMITYRDEEVSIDSAKNKALIIVFENGSYGYVSSKRLVKYFKGKPLKAKYFNPEKITFLQLKQKVFN
ncbi:MAG: hypothetical protein NT150_05560 [Bacteroidetes bacterium]|nr:hypothetical protein [Bacteroidota bacterium]